MSFTNPPTFLRPIKLHESWLDHKSSQNSKWMRYWCVLRCNVIYIFTSPETNRSTHVGTLHLDRESKLVNREGDEKSGYRFDLHTKGRINKFKTTKFSERELWRAFVEGITTGHVSHNIDLLEGQIADVQSMISHMMCESSHPSDSPLLPSAAPTTQEANVYLPSDGFELPYSLISSYVDESMFYPNPRHPLPDVVCSVPDLQNVVFFTDPSEEGIPSWFFSNCSRQLAQEILIKGAQYGNTLMRLKEPGSFVISKRPCTSSNEFLHFKVDHQPRGYKLDVENPHDPMKSLEEVMEFFVQTSGAWATCPMTCNDLNTLGVISKATDNLYHTKISHANTWQGADHPAGTWSHGYRGPKQLSHNYLEATRSPIMQPRFAKPRVTDLRFRPIEDDAVPQTHAPLAPTHTSANQGWLGTLRQPGAYRTDRSASVPDVFIRQNDMARIRQRYNDAASHFQVGGAPSTHNQESKMGERIYEEATNSYEEPVINTVGSGSSMSAESATSEKPLGQPPLPHKTIRPTRLLGQTKQPAGVRSRENSTSTSTSTSPSPTDAPTSSLSTSSPARVGQSESSILASPAKPSKPKARCVPPVPVEIVPVEYENDYPLFPTGLNKARPLSSVPPPLPPNHPPPLQKPNVPANQQTQVDVEGPTPAKPLVEEKPVPSPPELNADSLKAAMANLKDTKDLHQEDEKDKETQDIKSADAKDEGTSRDDADADADDDADDGDDDRQEDIERGTKDNGVH